MKALPELEHIADYIRRTPQRCPDRHMGAHETSCHLQATLEAEISANHPYRHYLFILATRYRALAQDLIAQRGYGLLESFNLYRDAVNVIRSLEYIHLQHRVDIPRILDWRKNPFSIQLALDETPRVRTMHYLRTIEDQPPVDGNILHQSRRHLAYVARLLFDDFPENTANNIAYVEFTIDAQAAIRNPALD